MEPRLLLRNLNIFRDWLAERHGSFRWVLAGLAVVCFVNTAQALDANRSMSDYIRDRWGADQGFPGGPVYAIAQTADGYLWIGTEKGLVRFDGLNFHLFSPKNSAALTAGPILDLMTDAEGNLWIRPQSRNMLRYRDGTFQDVMPDLDSAHSGVTAMCRGPKGEALFAVRTTGTFMYSGGRFEKLLSTAGRSNLLVISMAKTGDGNVWMGTRDAGLFFMSQEQSVDITKGLPDRKINCLLAGDERELWIGTDNGVVRWNGDEATKAGVPDSLDHIQALAMTRDRESNIWIGTGKGLLRLNASGVSSLAEADQGSTGTVNTIFEDREGNLWVGSTRGIERLRDSAFMTFSISRALSSEGNGAVYVDAEGRIWFAPSDGGLYWQKAGQTGQVKNAGLDKDVIYSLTGSKGELWIGRRRGGLTHLRYNDGSFTTETYTQAEGLAQDSIYAVHQSRDQTVWAGSISGGVSRFKDGKFTTYTAANGLASNTVTAILESSDGTMWFATANGLSSLRQDNWTIYRGLEGLPPGSVNCLLEDSSGAIWMGTDNGIAVLRSGEIEVPREVPESLHEPILGVAEDRNGWLWISTSNHILRADRDKLLSGVASQADVREFGLADGLRSAGGIKRHRSVVMDALGRIWLSTNRGLSVVDPKQVADHSVPAMVHIEGVAADGSVIDLQGAVRIPGARQRITFSYAGLSLSVPERVRFRYKLDGFDQDWSEPVATREAVYTNLSPGAYRFRVIASNSDGLWNGLESAIQFEIEPLFWQTWWFRLSCVMVAGLAILAFYRLRLHRLTRQLNVRFEERLAERTRIAQDLHDTLLQGFLSASMQLHVAADHLSTDSPAKPLVSRVLELMRQVIDEGRIALQGLRSSNSSSSDLAQAFSGIQTELALQERIDYQVTVIGPSRPLHPIIRDAVYRIGREALVNAFRHSRAKSIEVVLEYGSKQLRILVRDNGCGIDPQVLRSGREGHWGLSGMRERAEEIGARLKVLSAAGAGTEVELAVPSDIAFEPLSSERRRNWFAKWYPRKARAEIIKAEKRKK
jgi:ligand-binding sensor domain-containing protein/signal transduction histidine kinase